MKMKKLSGIPRRKIEEVVNEHQLPYNTLKIEILKEDDNKDYLKFYEEAQSKYKTLKKKPSNEVLDEVIHNSEVLKLVLKYNNTICGISFVDMETRSMKKVIKDMFTEDELSRVTGLITAVAAYGVFLDKEGSSVVDIAWDTVNTDNLPIEKVRRGWEKGSIEIMKDVAKRLDKDFLLGVVSGTNTAVLRLVSMTGGEPVGQYIDPSDGLRRFVIRQKT